MQTKIPELPKTNDDFWDSAETSYSVPKKIGLCSSHFKKWHKHDGYIDNHDGTISCMYCPWGTVLPGFYKVYKGKVVDLRKL